MRISAHSRRRRLLRRRHSSSSNSVLRAEGVLEELRRTLLWWGLMSTISTGEHKSSSTQQQHAHKQQGAACRNRCDLRPSPTLSSFPHTVRTAMARIMERLLAGGVMHGEDHGGELQLGAPSESRQSEYAMGSGTLDEAGLNEIFMWRARRGHIHIRTEQAISPTPSHSHHSHTASTHPLSPSHLPLPPHQQDMDAENEDPLGLLYLEPGSIEPNVAAAAAAAAEAATTTTTTSTSADAGRRRPLPGRRLCLPLRASTRSRWRALL